MKKIISLAICALFLTNSVTAFANGKTVKENIYTLAFGDTSEYGYSEAYWVDKNGDEVDFEGEIKEQKSSFKKKDVLPDFYNSAEQGFVTEIKDQGVTGSCWAFSAMAAAESSIVKKSLANGESIDLSEAHHVWFTHNSLSQNENDPASGDGVSVSSPYYYGGNWLRSTFSLARGNGFALENDYPFYPNNVNAMGNYGEEDRYVSEYHLTDSYTIPETETDAIKEAIISNGAVTVAFYMTNKYLAKNTGNYCYYCPEEVGTNHQVTVVGWDNNYSASNFNSSYQPSSNGAWIVKNSYSSSWGNNGYFYLSFSDMSLKNFQALDVEGKETYTDAYQYDGYGYSMSLTGTASGQPLKTASEANVFTAKKTENINSVAFYTVNRQVDYKIEIYKSLPDGFANPVFNGVCALTQSGRIEYAGYYKINLNEEIKVEKGENFSVVVTLTSSDEIKIPLEGISGQNDGSYVRYYSSSPNQSFYRFGETSSWQDSSSKGYNNVCIKAFACEPDINEISTAQELCDFAQSVNKGNSYKGKTIKLLCDVDMKDVSFEPIGTQSCPFDGTFDGNGKTISNLTVSGTYNVGLFGVTGENSIIKLLGLENVSVTGSENVGGLAGKASGKRIYNCYCTGDIAGTNNVGGLAGQNLCASTDNCFSIAAVTAQSVYGSLAGYDNSSYINCFAPDNAAPTGNSSQPSGINCIAKSDFENGYAAYMLQSSDIIWTKGAAHPVFTADENETVHLATVFVVSKSEFKRIYLTSYEDITELLEQEYPGYGFRVYTDYACTNEFTGSVTFDRTLFASLYPKELILVDGSTYKIENSMLLGVFPSTIAMDVRTQFINDNILIVRPDGAQLSYGDAVYTGCKVCLTDEGGAVLQEITVSVFGDLYPDGVIDSFDMSVLCLMANFQVEYDYDGVFAKSGDLNFDGFIDVFDVAIMSELVNFE